jgi:hypothetical protein
LAKDLKAQAIKGLGAEVLRTCRLFFLSYPEISQTLSGKLELSPEHGLNFPDSVWEIGRRDQPTRD